MCPDYICTCILEIRNTNSNLMQVYLGAWAKIEIVIENHVWLVVGHSVITVFKRYPSTYIYKCTRLNKSGDPFNQM